MAINFLNKLKDILKSSKVGKIATIMGRFYAMDRNNNWNRTEKAYNAMTKGIGEQTVDPFYKLQELYRKEINDEEMVPIVTTDNNGNPIGNITENDLVFFFNFRSDRARQLTKAFSLEKFNHFKREKIKDLYFLTMMKYEENLPVNVVFEPIINEESLGAILSENNKSQLRIAETEKYAHVTYFFNGGVEKPHKNEKHILVPSPRVDKYDTVPQMSAEKVTDELIEESKNNYDFILVNYANPDMVGHTGNLNATIEAINHVDECLKKVYEHFVLDKNYIMIVTSDHGNCDVMIDPITSRANKEHTTNPVPFFIIGEDYKKERSDDEVYIIKNSITPIGILADIAPTILDIMGLNKDENMTGRSILEDCI